MLSVVVAARSTLTEARAHLARVKDMFIYLFIFIFSFRFLFFSTLASINTGTLSHRLSPLLFPRGQKRPVSYPAPRICPGAGCR